MFFKQIKKVAKSTAAKIEMAIVGRLVLGLGWLYGFWVFKVRHKIEVVGKENIPRQQKVLFVSNHETLIDSFLIGSSVCRLTDVILHYDLIPWNTPDENNFFNKKFFRWIFGYLKNIPLARPLGKLGTKTMMKQLGEVGQKLNQGTVLMFFEGTRTRDGQIGECRPGVAEIISEHKPVVIPILLENIQQVMPIDVGFDFIWPLFPFIIKLKFKPEFELKFKPKLKLKLKPNFKLRVTIKKRIRGRLVIGPPIEFNGILGKPKNGKTRKEIGQTVWQVFNDWKNKTLASS